MRITVLAATLLACSTGLVASPAQAAASCGGKPATIEMTPGQTTVDGTDGDDVIVGTDGADTIRSGAGNDTVCSKAGNDSVDGGAGDDTVYGGQGNDSLVAGLGNDTLRGDSGHDILTAVEAPAVPEEGETDGDDRYLGGVGYDELRYSVVTLPLSFDLPTQTITGSGQDKTQGVQSYVGGTGDDVFVGTSGDDVYRDVTGRNKVTTGDGDDTVDANGEVSTGAGRDIVTLPTVTLGLEQLGVIRLGSGADQCIRCSADAKGGRGDDLFRVSGLRPATLDAGGGVDQLSFSSSEGLPNLLVDVAAGAARGAEQAQTSVAFAHFQRYRTGSGNDTLLGSAARDVLLSGGGDDVVRSRAGDDLLDGMNGQDQVSGGAGRDTCFGEVRRSCKPR